MRRIFIYCFASIPKAAVAAVGMQAGGGKMVNAQIHIAAGSFREKERKFFVQKSKTVEIAKYLS